MKIKYFLFSNLLCNVKHTRTSVSCATFFYVLNIFLVHLHSRHEIFRHTYNQNYTAIRCIIIYRISSNYTKLLIFLLFIYGINTFSHFGIVLGTLICFAYDFCDPYLYLASHDHLIYHDP